MGTRDGRLLVGGAFLLLVGPAIVLATGGCDRGKIPEGAPKPKLRARLDARKAKWLRTAPAEQVRTFERGIDELRGSGIVERARKVGDVAPDFELSNATGRKVRLSALLVRGPVVLAWYRGGWCPYCNIELNALQESLPEFRRLGATLVAITPERPDKSMTSIERNRLEFEVLSDVGNNVARRYGLVFKLSDDVLHELQGSVNLAEYNGNESNELPIPATYVVDTRGVIRFAFVDPDYRRRGEPAEIIAVLRELRKQ